LLDDLAILDFGSATPCFPVSVPQLKALSEPRARNLLRYLLANAAVQIPSEDRLREALRQLLNAGADRHPATKMGDRILRRRSGWVVLE
jgi:tRNA(Ile)-lysidine synthase